MSHPVVHAEIRSSDPDATRAFFSGLFGWSYSDGAYPGYTFVDTGVASALPTAISPLQGDSDTVLFFVGCPMSPLHSRRRSSSVAASSSRRRRFPESPSASSPTRRATRSGSPRTARETAGIWRDRAWSRCSRGRLDSRVRRGPQPVRGKGRAHPRSTGSAEEASSTAGHGGRPARRNGAP